MTTVSTILKSIKECKDDYSLGFKRMHFLPQRVTTHLNRQAVYAGTPVNEVSANLKTKLGDMNEQEYVQFLKDNGVRHKATKNEPDSPSL